MAEQDLDSKMNSEEKFEPVVDEATQYSVTGPGPPAPTDAPPNEETKAQTFFKTETSKASNNTNNVTARHSIGLSTASSGSTTPTDVPPVQLKTTEEPLIDEKVEKFMQQLEEHEFFHGTLPIEDISGLLLQRGDFLLRIKDKEEVGGRQETQACITIRYGALMDVPMNFMNFANGRKLTADSLNGLDTVNEILKLHHTLPVNGMVLVRGVKKQSWELNANRIEKKKKLGEGQFGEVWSGFMEIGAKKLAVAIKIMKTGKVARAKCEEMFKESRIMRNLKHLNIVTFYGMVTKVDAVYIVMELMADGGLDVYLKNNKVSMENKISYCFDTAFALYYMHSKGCIHRDVACRNCLIDVSKNIVKLSDFGLSKQTECYVLNPKDLVPIRWQAPEVLRKRIYTRESDVYSYGMLVYEIINDGMVPFHGLTTKEIRAKIDEPNFRPEMTAAVASAPVAIHATLTCCWRAAKERPAMKAITYMLVKHVKHPLPGPGGAVFGKTKTKETTKPAPKAEPTLPKMETPPPKAETPKKAYNGSSKRKRISVGAPAPSTITASSPVARSTPGSVKQRRKKTTS